MNCRWILCLLCVVVSMRGEAQTPPTTTPPSNPPKPTPIPTVVPANPVTAAPAQTGVPTIVLDSFDSVLDSFDSVTQWTTTPAEGVEVSVHPDPNGAHGKAMRVDFDFHGHGGDTPNPRPPRMTLPPQYRISLPAKGDAPTHTLHLKLICRTG